MNYIIPDNEMTDAEFDDYLSQELGPNLREG